LSNQILFGEDIHRHFQEHQEHKHYISHASFEMLDNQYRLHLSNGGLYFGLIEDYQKNPILQELQLLEIVKEPKHWGNPIVGLNSEEW